MSASKQHLEEELKSLKEQQAGLANQYQQSMAMLNQVGGAIQAIESLLAKHYAEDKIIVPTASQAAAVIRPQRQGEEQKRTLRFPVPEIQ